MPKPVNRTAKPTLTPRQRAKRKKAAARKAADEERWHRILAKMIEATGDIPDAADFEES
jgi:hypothetical protein